MLKYPHLDLFKVKMFVFNAAARGQECDVIEMGPNLFNGNLVFAWQKNYPYGRILNY